MKQLTMTKVLTPLAALAFAFGAQAAIVSPETFDTYTAGTTVISNQTGWSFTYGTDGADDASAVTAYDNNAPASNIVPDGQSAGANYLKLSTEDGTLFRNMSTDGGTLGLNAGLFVDTDVQFTVTDPSDRPAPTQDDKFIVWLEADNSGNTNLCVWAREYSIDGTVGFNNSSNKVYTLGSANAIVPNAWYRLTVKAEQSVGGSFKFPAFKVYINGVAQTANEYIVDNAADNQYEYDTVFGSGVVSGRAYLPAMVSAMTSLTKVGFSGEGALDSVVVTKDVPAFENPTTLTFTWDSSVISSIDLGGLGLSLSSSGSSVSVYPGQVITLTLNGYNPSTHSFEMTTSSDVRATVNSEAKTVTAIAAGAATIALNTTAKDTVDVTFDWSALNTHMSELERVSENTAISFTVGGEVRDADLGEETFTWSGLKVGTNITVTVTYSTTDWTTTITPANCMTKSGNVLTIESRPESGAATVYIDADLAAVKIGDTPYASLQEAVNNAASGATLTLAKNITLIEAVTVAAGKTITVDLNGQTITGAAEAAVFTNAGALTITDTSSNHDGQVVAGTDGFVVANTGTLNLVYGAYTGTFTGTITSITADCSFSYDISAGETPVYDIDDGYEMAVSAGRYSLAVVTYTITYKKGDAELELLPATYTVTNNVTLPSATPDAGYTFTGWKDAEDHAVTDWMAGAKTGNLVLTAQFSQNTYTITVGAPTSPVTVAATKNGAAAAITENAITANYDDTVVVTYSAPAGYNLTGTAVYEFTVTQNESTTAPTATAIEYSVTYNLDLTGATNAVGAVTAFTVETATFALLDAGCEGYTFNGWTNANGSAVTQVAQGTTADVVVYATWTADAPVTPTIDPDSGDTVENVEAATEEAATAKVKVAQPEASKTAAGTVSDETYQGYFKKTATETSTGSGVWTVKAELDPETVVEPATTSAAAIVSGTAASGKVAVPKGLYYKITTMTGLDGTGSISPLKGWSDGNGITVPKPGEAQGFIKVQIGADEIE